MQKKKSSLASRLTANVIKEYENDIDVVKDDISVKPEASGYEEIKLEDDIKKQSNKEPKRQKSNKKEKQHKPKKEKRRKQDILNEFDYSDTSKKMNEFQDILPDIEDNAKKHGSWKLSTRIINIVLIAGCVYLIFLIYGAIMTEYHYNDNGQAEAQKMSVSDIREQKAYEVILTQYINCRILYEEVLLLDYRISAGVEDPMTIAPEYEALLDEVTDLSVKTSALSVDTQYSQVKEMMVSWIQNDIAVYLQNMSTSISQNDIEIANYALQDKERVYSNFVLITQNILAMGEMVTSVDLTEIKSWTPEDYIDEKINGN